MKYEIINSGSDGNAIVLNDEILLDCGVSYKKIEPYVKKLKIVCISHRTHRPFATKYDKKISF